MYKQSLQEGYRYPTVKGLFTTEQLFQLSKEELNDLAVKLDAEYNNSGKKSFLVKKSVKDKKTKIMLDVVLDILDTKQNQEEAARTARENKEHNDKIFEIIAKKQDQALESKSISELKKELR